MAKESVTRAERVLRTRDQIVRAAVAVFALKGVASSSMDDIRLAAGVSKGGLYHHFASKGQLLGAVADELEREDALLPRIDGGSACGVSAEALGRLLIGVWAEAARDGDLRERLLRGYAARRERTAEASNAIADLLRVGALVQLLTRNEALADGEAARLLGVERAA